MTKPYRVYRTKQAWERHARVFMIFGLVCGFGIGIALSFLVYILTEMFS